MFDRAEISDSSVHGVLSICMGGDEGNDSAEEVVRRIGESYKVSAYRRIRWFGSLVGGW